MNTKKFIGKKSALLITITNLIKLYWEKNDNKNCIKLYFEKLNLLKEQDKTISAIEYENIGRLYIKLKNIKEAKNYYEKAYNLRLEKHNINITNDEVLASIICGLGDIETLNENYQEAKIKYEESLCIYKNIIQLTNKMIPIVIKKLSVTLRALGDDVEADELEKEATYESIQLSNLSFYDNHHISINSNKTLSLNSPKHTPKSSAASRNSAILRNLLV